MSSEVAVTTKKKNRLLKEQRRRHPDISKEIILLWEELRQRSVKAERKSELCQKIMKVSKSVLIDLIKQKTTARVFESVVEFGNEEHRWTIFEIVKPELLELCKGKYSYFVVNNVLKYGTKEQRLAVFGAIKGNVVDLTRHVYASKVVEVAYNEVATSSQRREMVQEFYGKTFMLFKNDNEVANLNEVTNATAFDMSILKNLHKLITPVLTKTLTDLSIVQHVLLEYFEVLVAARTKQAALGGVNHYDPLVEEIVDLMQDQLLKLCNTREGTKVAMSIYWQSNSKARKKVLTAAKEVISDLCVSENAYLFVLAILDQTDDVKALEKNIIKPIIAEANKISANTHGRKILQFIISHRDKNFFATATLVLLEKGDCNPYSKKEASIRSNEILEIAKKPLLEWLSNNIDRCFSYSTYLNVARSIIAKCIPSDEQMQKTYNIVLTHLVHHIDEPMVPVTGGNKRKLRSQPDKVPKKKAKTFVGKFDEETNEVKAEPEEETEDMGKIETHLLDSSGCQVLIRSIFSLEKEKRISGFSDLVMKHLHAENLVTFVTCNRTAFFLVQLFECGNAATPQYLRTHLQSVQSSMAKTNLQGVKILYKHLF